MKTFCKIGFIHSFGVLVYIAAVAALMINSERIFGKMNDIFGPIAFLLLFSLSALVVGGLILEKPLMLYLDSKQKEAVQLVLCTGGWLFLFTIIALIIIITR